jgi:Transcriptional regulators containing a DNA-binding HTH domain and an aminotransferase domain (MocR family) and their eukaryotic orthologs
VDNSRTNPPDWSIFVPVLPDKGPRPQALYAEIRRLIEEGALSPGDKLPTTRDLAGRFWLSRGAAVAAYDMLVADGFAEARVGAGTYVARAVPNVGGTPVRERRRPPEPKGPLPGALGCSTADETTIRTFRTLLNRHLTQPSARHYHYGDPAGGEDLRTEIAAYLRAARGVRCEADQVIVTSGTQQALDLVIRSLLHPGDPVWVEDPCYPMAKAAFLGVGMRLNAVPVDTDGVDPDAGERLAPQARAVYVTPSHQYPLGVTLTMPRRLKLIDWARRTGAFIIEDDYDSEFRFSGPPLTSLQGIDGEGRVIYVGSFSKTLMPGFRIGYLVAPRALIGHMLEVRQRIDRFPSTLFESALAEFLRDGHFASHVKRARRRVKEARDVLVDVLRQGGLQFTIPEQGLHMVAVAPDGRSDVEHVTFAAECGFGLRALSPLYHGGNGRQGLVIGFSGFPAERLAAAARRWVQALC